MEEEEEEKESGCFLLVHSWRPLSSLRPRILLVLLSVKDFGVSWS